MFKSITLLRWEVSNTLGLENNIVYTYLLRLEDTDFEAHTTIRGRDIYERHACIAFIIREYKTKDLPVAKNLALYYLSLRKTGQCIDEKLFERDRKVIENRFPYAKNYYPCVINQFKMLTYAH